MLVCVVECLVCCCLVWFLFVLLRGVTVFVPFVCELSCVVVWLVVCVVCVLVCVRMCLRVLGVIACVMLDGSFLECVCCACVCASVCGVF